MRELPSCLAIYKEHYGGCFWILALLCRTIIIICSSLVLGFTAIGVTGRKKGTPYDPSEVFGLILSALVIFHSILCLIPKLGIRSNPTSRIWEWGANLAVLYGIFCVGLWMTPGEMRHEYVAPGTETKDQRLWSAFIAATIAAVLLIPTSLFDFLARRRGEGESSGNFGKHDTFVHPTEDVYNEFADRPPPPLVTRTLHPAYRS